MSLVGRDNLFPENVTVKRSFHDNFWWDLVELHQNIGMKEKKDNEVVK